MYVKWSQDQYTWGKSKRKKRKYIIISLHPSKYKHSPKQKYHLLTLPLNTWLLSSQNYSPFLSQMPKCKSLRSHHLIIIIIISILVLRILWRKRRRWRRGEATHASLSSCDTTNTGVHLKQLNSECIKVSIHVLKLCHDDLKHHTTTRRRGSKGGWNGRS